MAMTQWTTFTSTVSSPIIGMKFIGRMGRRRSRGIATQLSFVAAKSTFSEVWTPTSRDSTIFTSSTLINASGRASRRQAKRPNLGLSIAQ